MQQSQKLAQPKLEAGKPKLDKQNKIPKVEDLEI